jgi:translation initiation factor IF-3|nr:translation initiation factor IF-3 [Telmatocola sphagniphila]
MQINPLTKGQTAVRHKSNSDRRGSWVLLYFFDRRPFIPPFDRDRNAPPRPGDRNNPRINEQIRLSPIRLIGANGEQHGIVPTAEAMMMARDQGLDLVEVSASERPPVCKLMDYGKFRYEQTRKSGKAKAHQQKVKEIRVRPKTGEHDIDTKVAQARKFLEHHDKVQVNVMFRGREMQHIEEGQRIIKMILEKLVDCSKVEKPPSLEGKRMTAMLAPKSGK